MFATLLFIIKSPAYLEQVQHNDRWKRNGSKLVEWLAYPLIDESLQMKNRG
jgi:hypothetical protein